MPTTGSYKREHNIAEGVFRIILHYIVQIWQIPSEQKLHLKKVLPGKSE